MRNLSLSLFFIICLISSAMAQTEPTPGNQVFSFKAAIQDPNRIKLDWKITPGFFLYRDRIHIENQDSQMVSLAQYQLPAGKIKQVAGVKAYQVYQNQLSLMISVLGSKAGKADLIIRYQGCSEAGFCYPPMAKRLAMSFNDQGEVTYIETSDLAHSAAAPLTEAENILNGKSFLIVMLSFFGFGLLLSFTPCVLPMVPILSGIIVGQGEKITTRHAFGISLTYVLSMSTTYAILGIIIALLGANLQAQLQTPIVIVSFAALAVALAFSMFGYYDIKLPTRVQLWLANVSNRQHSGTYIGAFIMGALSTLVLSPCVTPALVGALSYIANTGNAFHGAVALFCLGFGMGTPLLLIGTGARHLLPTAGMWMNTVKSFFGFALLGLAIVLLGRLLPGHIILALWASLFVVGSIFMGALQRNPDSPGKKVAKGIGIIALVYGIILFISASMGHDDLLQPLKGLHSPASQSSLTQHKIVIKSPKEFHQLLAKSKKPILLDFYADWCIACKVMEKSLFRDPDVIKALQPYTLVKADITAYSNLNQKLMQQLQVIAPPTFLFFDEHGTEKTSLRIIGEIDKQQFIQHLIAGAS